MIGLILGTDMSWINPWVGLSRIFIWKSDARSEGSATELHCYLAANTELYVSSAALNLRQNVVSVSVYCAARFPKSLYCFHVG